MVPMNDNDYIFDDDLLEIKSEDEQFDMYFDERYNLMINRVERMKELNNALDYGTYVDMIFISLRALLLEGERYSFNYTVQNFLRRKGRDDLVDEINKYLDTQLNSLYSLKEIIKIKTDKFIVHYDTLQISEGEMYGGKPKNEMNNERILIKGEVFKANLFSMDITNKNYPFNIESIVAFIQSIVDKANVG